MTRIVITGVGLITSIGAGRETFWKALLAGCSGISPVASFDTSEFPSHLGGEVHDFSPEPYLRRQPPGELGRASQMAVAAARLAIEDSGLDLASPGSNDLRRAGVSMGTTSGEPWFVERHLAAKNG